MGWRCTGGLAAEWGLSIIRSVRHGFQEPMHLFWLGYLLRRSQEAVRSEEDEFKYAPVVDDELE